ncbi:MAG: fumarate hydratase [Lawsonibacter sp.]
MPCSGPIDQAQIQSPFYAAAGGGAAGRDRRPRASGPRASAGKTTCLGLSIETAPTHVAGLPVAVNVSCHVTRRAAAEL